MSGSSANEEMEFWVNDAEKMVIKASGNVGINETIVEGTGVTVAETGVSATGSAGSVSVTEGEGVTFAVTGLSATATTAKVNVWSAISTTQTPSWTDIAA